jgi:predicted deacetylase
MSRIAVALHDVEPATFERCALIRDWLCDLGIDRATLLVVPAPALHPFDDLRPELAAWLAERTASGDAIAQHGLEHRAREFAGLGEREARRALLSGRRLLRLAGLEPRGFVAPGYVYTGPLRAALRATFEWWATTTGVHGSAAPPVRAPLLWPPLLGRGGFLAGSLLRLDLHPDDFARLRHVRTVERVLRRAEGRQAVTYDDLAGAL